MSEARLSRREFLAAGGSLVVAFALPSPGAFCQEKAAKLPGSLAKAPLLDSWIRIDEKGNATVFTGKAELGQGIKTALIQVAAEELVLDPARITLVTADTERTPNEMYTAGSHSMQDSGTAIRHAAAQVRAILLALAADRLGAPSEALGVENGIVRARAAGRSIGYGELVAGQALHVEASPASPLITPAAHRVMGKFLARVDIPAKVTGGAAYVQDLRLEGMVHGRIVRPPSPAAKLRALDASRVARMPGVLKVVRDGRFIGVIAEREWQCVQAMRALAAAARWAEQPSLPDPARLYETLLALPAQDDIIANEGTVGRPGAKRIEATYRRPYQLHASVGPSCAVAQLLDGRITVWTHSQGVYPLREALAEMLGVSKERVHCIHAEGSGCYGHNAADDVAADAALLARALPGRAVRVQWMREDEHVWEPFGPAMVSRAAATLDGGQIAEWQFEVWSNTHSTRPGKAGDLLAATHLERPFAPTPPKPLPQPEGGGDRNAIPLYDFANVRVVHHFIPQMPLRVSALRALGAYANVFALESFMDELAAAAKADPVELRLRHLRDERARAVIRLAADKFGWANFGRRAGRGRGFAFARYKNLAGYMALAVELEAQRDTGLVRLVRAVAAADSGEAVSPDGIRNQIEGGIIQSASWTLAEEVTFDRTRITSRDWGGYPILRFPSIPASIEVHVIERPGQPFLGTGEVSQGPTAAAIGNALADATGVRLRDLPFSRARVRAALEG